MKTHKVLKPQLQELNPIFIALECQKAWLESERIYQGARYEKQGSEFRIDWLQAYMAGEEL